MDSPKFYKDVTLPSSPTPADDGIYFIKPPSSGYIAYIISDGIITQQDAVTTASLLSVLENYVSTSRTLTAGNGLSGGGNLTANRTFTLGTPSSIGLSTTNAVTSSSHTHALDTATITAINNGQTAFGWGNHALAGYIPYTGATSNVNLGTRSITSTGGFLGNATTATTLVTARTINGTSFNGSANIVTANWGTSRNITIGNTTKSVNGSGNVAWSLAEIGSSQDLLQTLANGNIADNSGYGGDVILFRNSYGYSSIFNSEDMFGLRAFVEHGIIDFTSRNTSWMVRTEGVKDFQGITGEDYYGNYYTDTTYVQKIYVDANFVPTARKLTINGTTFDLSTDRTWNITDTVTRLRATSSGTYTSGDITLLAGVGIGLSQFAANITITNNSPNATHTGDVTGDTTLTIANSAVTHAKYQNIATQRILGRGATGTGNVEELTLGSNLSLSTGGVLSATNTNTTYSAGTGLSLLGTTFGQAITTNGTGSFVTGITQTTNGFQVNLGTPPNTNPNDGTLTLATGTGLSGSATFSANQSTNSTFTVGIGSGYVLPTTAQTTSWDNKQNAITGGATTIVSSNLTANRALISNASGKVAVSPTTSNELGYLSGVTSSIQTQLNDKINTSLIGANNGVASLGSDGKINSNQLPALAITETFPVSTQAQMLALTAQQGDVAIRSDINKTFILRQEPASTLANWEEMLMPASGVQSVAMSVPTGFSISGSPITSTGTLSLGYASGYQGFTTAQSTKLAGIATGANNYTLPIATATVPGGIELFSNTVQSVAANAVTATTSRTYGLQLNNAGQAVVNIPWTNTTYSAGTGLSLSGTTFNVSYGTSAGTSAQGNDSRINNGQTAFGWGNHAGLYPSIASLGGSSNSVLVLDTRSTNPLPSTDLQRGVWFDFKQMSVIGTGTDSSTYGASMTFVPYGDDSGNNHGAFRITQSSLQTSGIPQLFVQKYRAGSWYEQYRIWHEGNLLQSNIDNWNTAFGWGNHSSMNYWRSTYIIADNAGTVTDLDSALPQGGFIANYGSNIWGGADRPSGASYGGYIKFLGTPSDNNNLDFYYNNGHGGALSRLWYRTKHGSGITNWLEFIHTGNLDTNVSTLGFIKSSGLSGYIPYTGANQDINFNTQKITHNGIVSNVRSITSPWLSQTTTLSTNNKAAYLIIDGFTANTHRQLYIEVESVAGNGQYKRLVKGFNVNFTNTNNFIQLDSRYLEVTGSGGDIRYGIGEVEKHSDTALKIPLINLASGGLSINKISVKSLYGSVTDLTFSIEYDATSTLTTENPYLYRNASEKWVKDNYEFRDYGLGITAYTSATALSSTTIDDPNLPNGLYHIGSSQNTYFSASADVLIMRSGSTGYTTQKMQLINSGDVVKMYLRHYKVNTSTWTPWREVITNENLDAQATSLGFIKSSALSGYVPTSRTLTAGNGLSGGGTLAANRTFTLGTPSSIGLSSTNAVTSTSHTHALDAATTTAINNGQTAFGWGNHAGRYLSNTISDLGYTELFSGDLTTLPNGSYIQAISGSATNGASGIGVPRSLISFGARSSGDSVLQSDILIGTAGFAVRNRTDNIWRTAWHSGNLLQSSIDNWNTTFDLVSLGGVSRTSLILSASNDLDLVVTPGYYHHNASSMPLNRPLNVAGYLEIINNGANDYIRQIWRGRDVLREFQRVRSGSSVWSNWVEHTNTDNLDSQATSLGFIKSANYYQSDDVNIPQKGGDYRVFPDGGDSEAFDWDTIIGRGFYKSMSGGSNANANAPQQSGFWHAENLKYASNITQYAHPYRVQDGKWMRNRYSGVWTPWVEFIHSGNLATYANTLLTGFVPSTRTLTAGNGLSGGGNLTANRTFTLGTPSAITLSSTNSVTSTSHTHALDSATTTAINNGNTAFGWGNHATAGYFKFISLLGNESIDSITVSGFYQQGTSANASVANNYPNGAIAGMLRHYNHSAYKEQYYSNRAGGRTWYRTFNTTWSDWVEFIHSGNLATYVPTYTLPVATATVLGGIELFSNTVQTVAANTVSTMALRTYGVQLNAAGQAVVNVPWADSILQNLLETLAKGNIADDTGSGGDVIRFYNPHSGGYSSIFNEDGTFGLQASGELGSMSFMGEYTSWMVRGGIEGFQGITGEDYYGPNYSALSYVQKKYVDDSFINRPGVGTNGQVLTTDGAGGVSWTTVSGGGGGTYTGSTSIILSGSAFQRAALTGDVTSAQNSNATTIATSAVTHAKYQNIATQRILGRGATGTGNVQELTLGSNIAITTAGVINVDITSSLSNYVPIDGNMTINGTKTFSVIPVLPSSNPTTANQATRKGYVDGLDTANVKLTGTQTVAGTKTFSTIPVLPASNPTSANQAVRKQYVDDYYSAITLSELVTGTATTVRGVNASILSAWLNTTGTTGGSIQFDQLRTYGTWAAPITANLSINTTSAKVGMIQEVYWTRPLGTIAAAIVFPIGMTMDVGEKALLALKYVNSSRVEVIGKLKFP